MRSSWNPSEQDLADYAEGPITYEIEMLMRQLALRISLDPGPRHPPPEEGALLNALLEACLVHLRLLDDFLGSPRQAKAARPGDLDDIFARHWHPGWRPSRFLTEQQISDINAQLAHLAARREHWQFPWPLDELAADCSERFEQFCIELEASNPERAAAFAIARSFAMKILAEHRPYA